MGDRTQSKARRVLCSAAAALSALALAGTASAQGLSLQRFEPSFAGDKLFGVQSAYTAGHNELMAMVLLDYAHDPLIARDPTGKDLGSIVGGQTLLHLHLSYALFHRLTLDLDVPFGFQTGDQPTPPNGGAIPSPTGGAIGDVRIGARVTLVGKEDDPFQLALSGVVWTPSGSRAAFLSDGDTRGEPMLVMGGASKYLVYSINAGVEIRPKATYANVTAGNSFNYGVGIGFLPGDGDFQIGPEVTGMVNFSNPVRGTTDAEALMAARLRFAKSLVAGFGAGGGFTRSFGTPDFRTVLSLSYAPTGPKAVADRDGDGVPDETDACPDIPGIATADPKTNGCPAAADRDGDGITDDKDACPDVPGPANADPSKNGCPADRDGDGIPDDQDACPDVPGVKSSDPKRNGCPPDRDNDGIPDDKDACPDVPGVADPDPAKNGCPGDRDHDGITDDKDACPDEKGPADPDPKKNGCPKEVRVADDAIVLLEQVEFDNNQATIRPSSDKLLATIAQVMTEHPEIRKVEVQGHTDNRGSANLNLKLSQRRAEAVVKALEKRGIAGTRMMPKGYGPSQPIAPNETADGRQKNRRVEVKILEKAPKKP